MRFISIGNGDLRAEISPFGAALARVWLRGHDTSLVLGLYRPEDYANAPHAIGVIVGPIAGRVAGAQVSLNGTDYQMEPNTPPDCLHSGTKGIQHRQWQIESQTAVSVTLLLALPDGACGLPGNRLIRARYTVSDCDVTLRIEATSDADTYVNATSHAYWVLDDSASLRGHLLQVASDDRVDLGADLIPTGTRVPLQNTPYDFDLARCPVDDVTLDTPFCLTAREALDLRSTISGVRLRVDTNQPAMVLYTGENLPYLESPEATPTIAPFSAIAIEAQGYPDAPNQPEFPSILLRKDDTLTQITRFKLSLP